MKTNDIVFIFCPPYKKYPEPPSDISSCKLTTCPVCQELMWLSEKKETVLKLSNMIEKKILLFCYDCFEKHIENEKESYSKRSIEVIEVKL